MNKIKKYIKSLAITISTIIILSIIINTLNYINILNQNTYKILIITSSSIATLLGTYYLGKQTKQKGYLEGIKYGIIITTLFITLALITKQNINIESILYYLILITTSIIGAMIGINRKKEEKNLS